MSLLNITVNRPRPHQHSICALILIVAIICYSLMSILDFLFVLFDLLYVFLGSLIIAPCEQISYVSTFMFPPI